MSQKFPNLTENSFIDTGILELQDRDDAALTLFYGNAAPENPFQDLIWNDYTNHSLKWYNDDSWETIINYGTNYISEVVMSNTYQPLNSNLTTYSGVTHSGTGLITNAWVPMSSFFINNISQEMSNNIGLKSLAFKSKLTPTDIQNGSITLNKLSTGVETNAPFKTGDCIPSFNSGNKSGCVKLSKSSTIVYTVGGSAANPTYRGDDYKNLYKFVWENMNLPIYTSTGVASSKGSSWSSDWNNNKKLELPHIDLPEADAPQEVNFTSGASVDFIISKSGYYEVTLIGGGGGGAACGAGTWGHQGSCSGASGAGFKAEILLNKNDVLTYTIGTGGSHGELVADRSYPGSQGSAGTDSILQLNGEDIVTCGAGGGAQAWWRSGYSIPSGGTVTVHKAALFSNVMNVPGPNGVGGNDANKREVLGPFGTSYGKGGSAQAWGDYSAAADDGTSGYFNIKFLAPKEYGTSNSEVKTALDNLYNSITYFMKY